MGAVFAAALTVLLGTDPAAPMPAADPCADDVRRLCPDVTPGGRRISRCLRRQRADLSETCRAQLDADDRRARRVVEEFGRACLADVEVHCPDVEPGGGRILGCLAQHQLDLSASCQGELNRIDEARARVQTTREACAVDVRTFCRGVPPQAGPLLDCLQANASRLTGTCSASDVRGAIAAVFLVDALEEMTQQDRVREVLQILQGVDSVAFSRSQALLQFDSYQALGGVASATRILFNPQFVFGQRRQFAFQVKAPVKTLYPSTPGGPTLSGLGEITAALAWNVASQRRFRHYLSLGLQCETAAEPALGLPWALQPAYALAAGLTRWFSITTQVVWTRSIGSTDDYPELNLLLLEPILVANLPGRAFVSLDTKLGWNLAQDGSFIPTMKGVAGIFVDRRKSLSMSAWYQQPLTSEAEAQSFESEVGLGLAYFFDW
jgi:hypothetical protein